MAVMKRSSGPTTHSRGRLRTTAGVLLALTLVVTTVTPTAAVARTTSTGEYWLTIGLWGGWARYGAQWDISQTQDAGQTWWVLRRVAFTAVARPGKTCLNSGYCRSFSTSVKAEVLSSSGQVLRTITNPSYATDCGWTYAYGADSVLVVRCALGGYQIGASANRIRFTWQMLVTRRDGVPFSWQQVTKTVAIQ